VFGSGKVQRSVFSFVLRVGVEVLLGQQMGEGLDQLLVHTSDQGCHAVPPSLGIDVDILMIDQHRCNLGVTSLARSYQGSSAFDVWNVGIHLRMF